jgi:predicted CoA-substrate-specific enzyme activase
MRTLGICLGASTLTIVDLVRNDSGQRVESVFSTAHESEPKVAIQDSLARYNPEHYDNVAVTGRKFRSLLRAPDISEPKAVEYALASMADRYDYDCLLSVGGETFLLYVLGNDGQIASACMGNKCAAGTGEFFLQQIRRMDLSPDNALAMADPDRAHNISGRCSVFCKSDCTHALNKGHDKGDIVAGLCKMVAGKMVELILKGGRSRVLAIGGVTRNRVAMEFLRREVDTLSIPEEAVYFEALGAALWAMENPMKYRLHPDHLFDDTQSTFEMLPALSEHESQVSFKSVPRGQAQAGDRCILGLDVGSTTTKALLLRMADQAILGSIYLRTNGDPVAASRQCYASLSTDLAVPVRIVGLGTTGSGRQIAGLHAQTQTVINEIIAHAKASVFFDEDVDTIFEIGGQDAKYTSLTNGVPCDYAMNEACSAGTGSFLEESAKESLNIAVEDIAKISMGATAAPSFNDQCAAFISSDIKNVTHEGVPRDQIVAGLVFSICMNYVNRVKGARPVGKKVFMQGGVCYNRAIPIAMAALIGKPIVVPPEPGLMGAFGAALVVQEQIELGLAEEAPFDLNDLAARTVEPLAPFVCPGKPEDCDRKCNIRRLRIDGKTFPFGGTCNKYYNPLHHLKVRTRDFNHIDPCHRIFMDKKATAKSKTVGINRSLLTHTYYPLFHTFFVELGLHPVLPDASDPSGVNRKNAAFCFPLEISHGMFKTLLDRNTDYLFMPHLQQLPVPGITHQKNACVFVQSEGYILRTAFKKELANRTVLAPRFSFAEGPEMARGVFIELAEELGFNARLAGNAFDKALVAQKEAARAAAAVTADALQAIVDSGEFGVALFGRPYNAFADEANMAIPAKFASRGIHILPFNSLPWSEEANLPHMFWAMGQMNLKAARYVRRHPNLFAVFVTNFSCGPDSFVLGRFRDIMDVKPSLTLELDSLIADAGIETRIEAFLDVVRAYRELLRKGQAPKPPAQITVPHMEFRGRKSRVRINGTSRPLEDIHIILPSIGRFTTEAVAAGARGAGVKATALPPADAEDLKLGRGNASCKECLPLIVNTGSFLKYLSQRTDPNEMTALFVPSQIDPCRLCQYPGFYDQLIRTQGLENVVVLSLCDQDGYGGLGQRFMLHLWLGVLAGDLVEDVHNALLVLACDPDAALAVLEEEWQDVLEGVQSGFAVIPKIRKMADRLAKIPLRPDADKLPRILLTGEIFVRKDGLSRQYIVETLAKHGFVVRVTPACETVYYSNYLTRTGMEKQPLCRRFNAWVQNKVFEMSERKLRRIMSATELCDSRVVDIERTLSCANHLVGRHIKGETSLTIGTSLHEIVDHVVGVISIGPFGCMPTRVSESVLSTEMTTEGRSRATGKDMEIGVDELPFLSIESDGGAFPQITETRIETFCLQAMRLHEKMLTSRCEPVG